MNLTSIRFNQSLLTYQYLLMTYLTDEEYQEIYKDHYKGKVSSIFKKLVELIGKQIELPSTKKKIYKSY